jgi:hypothetical protein
MTSTPLETRKSKGNARAKILQGTVEEEERKTTQKASRPNRNINLPSSSC